MLKFVLISEEIIQFLYFSPASASLGSIIKAPGGWIEEKDTTSKCVIFTNFIYPVTTNE